MILNDEFLKRTRENIDMEEFTGPAHVLDLLDTIADLKRQLAEHEEATATAMRIMLKGKLGAAQNAVRDDYPQMAKMLDAYVQKKVDRALAERPYALPDNSDPMFQREYVMVPRVMKCHACGVERPWHTPRGKELLAAIEPQQVYTRADVDRAVLAESDVMERAQRLINNANRAKVKP